MNNTSNTSNNGNKTPQIICAAKAEYEARFYEDVGDFYVGTERWWEEKKRSLVKFFRVYDLEREDNYVVLINTNLTTCTYKKGSKIPTTEITENRNYIVQLDKDIDVYDFCCLEEGQACLFKGRNENGPSPRFTEDEITLAINKALNR